MTMTAGRTEAATKPALLSIFPYCPPSASGARRNLAEVSGKEKKKKNHYIDVSANVRQLRLNRGCQASDTMRLVTLLHCKRLRLVQKNWRRKGGKKPKQKTSKSNLHEKRCVLHAQSNCHYSSLLEESEGEGGRGGGRWRGKNKRDG